jgi:hypothetical protein
MPLKMVWDSRILPHDAIDRVSAIPTAMVARKVSSEWPVSHKLAMRDILLLRLFEIWGTGQPADATRSALSSQLVVIPQRISVLAKLLVKERLAKWVWVRPERTGRSIRVLQLTDLGTAEAQKSKEWLLMQHVEFEGQILLLSDLLMKLGRGSLTDALRIARLTDGGDQGDSPPVARSSA